MNGGRTEGHSSIRVTFVTTAMRGAAPRVAAGRRTWWTSAFPRVLMQSMAEDSTLRDRLAVERTVLANERTLLAYVRTALAFVIAGVSAIEFLDVTALDVLGWIFVVAGAVTLVIGALRFARTRRQLAAHTPAEP